MPPSRNLVIVGAGGHARIVIDVAEDIGYEIMGVIDLDFRGQEEYIFGHPVIGDKSSLQQFANTVIEVALAIGENKLRANCFTECMKLGFEVTGLKHPNAQISRHTTIAPGVFISRGAMINAGSSIGENTIINTGAVIEHEVEIGAHSHIGPGAKLAGRVRMGDFVFAGIGVTVIDKITIGDNVILGAGSVVIQDVASNSTIVGVPGKPIK